MRCLRPSVLLLLLAAPSTALLAQEMDKAKFYAEVQKVFEFNDEKLLDKLVRQAPDKTWRYFQDLRVDVWKGKNELQPKLDMLKASWVRVFEGAETLDRIDRWVSAQSPSGYEDYIRSQNNASKAWDYYLEAQKDVTKRRPFEIARDALRQVVEQTEATGHKIETAEAYNLLGICLGKMPDRTVEDRKEALAALERFLELRQAWDFTKDQYYLLNANYVKAEKERVEAAAKEEEKKRAEGYGENSKGVEGLVMPGVAEVSKTFEFAPLATWDELDYSQRGGPIPAFWWLASFQGTDDVKLSWFRRTELHLLRVGSMKFAVSPNPNDPKQTQPVDVSGRPKASTFHLDPDGKVPYAMFFWMGGDRERIGECEINLQPAPANTPVYYRSAASWTIPVATETVTLYDDNCNGWPMDAKPFDGDFKMHTLGGETTAPLLDSMRVGKGPRVPFSEFLHAGAAGWFHVHRTGENQFGMRPLNPDYLKLGKVKLAWKGPKPTMPAQLVIQGRGDFASAMFDVASGKEVEVPAGEYQVIWGRVVQGKGAQLQMATIYAGDSKPFAVEAGKTLTLEMGAPFTIAFEREGSGTEVKIDATKILVHEKTGCVFAELQNMTLEPDVLAAKTAEGKGAKQIGEFRKITDADFLNAAVEKRTAIGLMLATFPRPGDSRDGDMTLTAKLPAEGMKVGLVVKKHPLFGKLESEFK